MKLKELSKENLRVSIEENRELGVPIAILFISVLLFFVFILPNLLSFPSKMGQRNLEVEKLNEIKRAKNILESTNANELNSEVEIVTNALPSEKNFELVLGAIQEAASKSNTQIINYQFSDSGATQLTPKAELPSLDFTIDLAGGVDQAASFASEIYSIYPISGLKSISLINGISEIKIAFYYKPFTSVNAQDVALARDKTSDEKKALQVISGWNQVDTAPASIIPETSTESASPF